jgi:hypothetical protein
VKRFPSLLIAKSVEDELEARPSYEEIESSVAFPDIDRQSYRDAACYLWKRADRAERDGLTMCGLSTHYTRFIALLCQRALSPDGVND